MASGSASSAAFGSLASALVSVTASTSGSASSAAFGSLASALVSVVASTSGSASSAAFGSLASALVSVVASGSASSAAFGSLASALVSVTASTSGSASSGLIAAFAFGSLSSALVSVVASTFSSGSPAAFGSLSSALVSVTASVFGSLSSALSFGFPSSLTSTPERSVWAVSFLGCFTTLSACFSCSSAAHCARRRLKPILRVSVSTFNILTSTSSPSLTTSWGFSILWSASSEMCNSPSRSCSSSTNAPKFVSFVTVPLIICPAIYFSGMALIHGSSVNCFTPSDTRRLSSSTSRTTHFTSWSLCKASLGWLYLRVQLKSETCIIPSTPSSISTNAPKFVTFRTLPVTIVPAGYF